MKKLTLLFLAIFFTTAFAQAQDYNTGIGLRGGRPSGLTIKHFISPNAALEGVVGWWYGEDSGLKITGLYQIHVPAFDVPGLNWYYGGGAHIGFHDVAGTGFGVDGVVGIEYKLPDIPVTIGLDLIPFIDFAPDVDFDIDGGIALRFVF